jgi:hypothetical protein
MGFGFFVGRKEDIMILVDTTRDLPKIRKHIGIKEMAKKLGCNISELRDIDIVLLYYRKGDVPTNFGRTPQVRALVK